jgi:hypothetical protein
VAHGEAAEGFAAFITGRLRPALGRVAILAANLEGRTAGAKQVPPSDAPKNRGAKHKTISNPATRKDVVAMYDKGTKNPANILAALKDRWPDLDQRKIKTVINTHTRALRREKNGAKSRRTTRG